eukprot:Colp12_sorted_trinity150504_noHs@17491
MASRIRRSFSYAATAFGATGLAGALLSKSEDKSQSHLELKLVQVMHRHGARTTGNDRLDPFPVRWECAEPMGNIEHTTHNGETGKYRTVFIPDRQAIPGSCFGGQLTKAGKDDMLNLGNFLRQRYIVKAGFLPDVFDSKLIHVRSTDVLRTIQSVQHLLISLYPQSKRQHDDDVIVIHTLQEKVENMYPNPKQCRRMVQLVDEFRKSVRNSEYGKEAHVLREKCARLWGVPVESLPQCHGIYDELACRVANGLPVPPGTTPDLIEELGALGVRQWFGHLEEPSGHEAARLGIGRFIGDLLTPIKDSVQGK